MLNQNQTPLLDAVTTNAKRPHSPFYTPGHKQGKGISIKLAKTFGKAVFRADLTELTELDNLFTPDGVILQAQQLAAQAFGASQTWFLVNGSTCGIEAAILATCNDGDKIILPRNVHLSAISGLILSGAIPIFINPEYDSILDIAHSITPQSLQAALEKHPDTKAVIMVYPTYYGVCGDIREIAKITHAYNIPLLVDEAHGAHFAFHPELPIPALAAGADLTVQSIHKTLGAITQASMLHLQGNRININRVDQALQLLESSSPSYLLLASLDAARQQIAIHGKELLTYTLQLADGARNKISQIPGLSVFDFPQVPGASSSVGIPQASKMLALPRNLNLDKTRLTVTVSQLGITGFEAEEILDEQFNVTPEFASLQHLTFIISLGNTAADIEQLVKAFTNLAKQYSKNIKNLTLADRGGEVIFENRNHLDILPRSPRQAFFADTETLPIKETINRTCAEIVCPYPPGIPVLMPGEIITPAALEYLQQIQSMGGFISNCADTSLCTLKIVKEIVVS
ncbi:MAG: aminotransferase class I/II-fold pyridoxal phosphate-dependent enzyme [Rivularia sp. T60_A2020_040]|nr:aminotransferase class I/II-fold pyridoxal phosphate-dependent enzyme [Rivularia sp. T60_A2020_040]